MADRSTPTPEPAKYAAYAVFVTIAALLVFSFVSTLCDGELRRRCAATCLMRPNYAGANRVAPDFELTDVRGHKVSLSSYRGKVVVLNFWSRTCGPCLEEMPDLAELTHVLKPKSDVAVVTVSTDEDVEQVKNTLKSILKDDVPFPVLMDPDAKIVSGRYGTSLYPETWIIDKRGVIRARFDGEREWSGSAIVEMVDQIRGGGYCPVEAKDGEFLGDGAKLCERMTGG